MYLYETKLNEMGRVFVIAEDLLSAIGKVMAKYDTDKLLSITEIDEVVI